MLKKQKESKTKGQQNNKKMLRQLNVKKLQKDVRTLKKLNV
jgi:hypothetical protein